jgi:hypothetical protein
VLLVLGLVAGVPAGTFAAVLGVTCPAAAQAGDCCAGGAANVDCMAVCAVSAAPVVSLGTLSQAPETRTDTAVALAPAARASLARAPDAAPPKSLLLC